MQSMCALGRKVVQPIKACIVKLQSAVEYRRRENGISGRSTRFPMFYALPLSSNFYSRYNGTLIANHCATQLLGLILASAFGAVHCIAWNFQIGPPSASFYPQLIWRVASMGITASPTPLIIFFLVFFLFQWPKRKPLFSSAAAHWTRHVFRLRKMGQVVVFLYVPARITLIILAFYDLAWLSPSAHRSIEWSSFIPHMG